MLNLELLPDGMAFVPRQMRHGSSISRFAICVALGLTVFFAACNVGQAESRGGNQHRAVGSRLADFKLDALTGKDGVSSQDLRGKVCVVNFWGPWCVYCRIEFPKLVELDGRLSKNDKYQFISISNGSSPGESPASLRSQSESILRQHRAKFPAYGDFRSSARNALAKTGRFGGLTYPTTLVLDKEGVIRGVWEGYTEGDIGQIESMVNKLLSETKE